MDSKKNTSQDKYIRGTLPLINTWLNDDEMILKDRFKVDKVDRVELCK